MGRRRIMARSVARLPRDRLEGAIVRLYRVLPLLASADPDIRNLVIIRLATVIEEVCRRLLEVYLDANPDDDSMELIMRRVPFDSARRGGWGGAVAASLNVSTISDVRSILDKYGASAALKGGVEEILTDVMGQRNMVVHGEGDATLDLAKAHRGVEEFARGAFRDSPPVPVMMDSAKASAAAYLPGHSRIAIELHESVVRRCRAAGAEPPAPAMLVYMGISCAALGRHADALAAYDSAVGIDGGNAAAHAGRGRSLASLGRHADALAAYDTARRLARGPDRTRHA